MIASEGRWLKVATLAEGWSKNTTKGVAQLLFWVGRGVDTRRREEERENVLNLLGEKQKLKKNKCLAEN